MLVLGTSNKDGGAHVDENVDDWLNKIKNSTDWEFVSVDNRGNKTKEFIGQNEHHLCLRQMSYEVFNSPSLYHIIRDLFPLN
ncbi:MAG: hypothetical protein EOP45_22470 [Sphingobacteriaceae bacterium]|nr:MAG: hypothetical protein EOP45_22470 [Sphingobacteriaceae bacterium]